MFRIRNITCEQCGGDFNIPLTSNSDIEYAAYNHANEDGNQNPEMWDDDLGRYVPPFRFAPCSYEELVEQLTAAGEITVCDTCGDTSDDCGCPYVEDDDDDDDRDPVTAETWGRKVE